MNNGNTHRTPVLWKNRGLCACSLLVAALASVIGCSDSDVEPEAADAVPSSTEELLTSLDEQTPELRFVLGEWTGDLDGILSDRFGLIRFLTVYEPMHYAIDGTRQGGISFAAAREFQTWLNQRLDRVSKTRQVRVVVIPVRRDELIPFVRDGRGDIAGANLTITPERLADVAFSDPFVDDAYEIVVTGPGGDPVASLDDLSDRPVFVRASSSYRESLERLNADLRARNLAPIRIVEVNELLDDGAILRMIDEGALPATVVDAHIAEFWQQMMPNLVLHDAVRPREKSRIAWAMQKDAPDLLELVNAFVTEHKKGTRLGNIYMNRYFRDTSWHERVASRGTQERLEALRSLFQEKAEAYDLDWRRLAAQAMQESMLDQSMRSPRGAIGLMQLMPATAREMGFDDITSAAANVEAGAKYMRHVIDTYFHDVEMNAAIDAERAREHAYALALASYNAGPTRIARIRRQAAERGVDPLLWFGEVEPLVARSVGSEPVTYVQNIFEYSIQMQLQDRLREDWEAFDTSGGRPWTPAPE